MWNNSGPKSSGGSKKRVVKRRPLHIRRITALMEFVGSDGKETGTKLEGRLILNDFTNQGTGVFICEPLPVGQDLILKINEPSKLQLNAKVISCQEHDANSHIISDHPYRYRIVLYFMQLKDEDKKAIQDFCDQVGATYLYTNSIA